MGRSALPTADCRNFSSLAICCRQLRATVAPWSCSSQSQGSEKSFRRGRRDIVQRLRKSSWWKRGAEQISPGLAEHKVREP